MVEADLVKWIWTNLPTLSVALILARIYVVSLRRTEAQDRRCAKHSALIKRLKDVAMSEHPNRAREILEGENEDD